MVLCGRAVVPETRSSRPEPGARRGGHWEDTGCYADPGLISPWRDGPRGRKEHPIPPHPAPPHSITLAPRHSPTSGQAEVSRYSPSIAAQLPARHSDLAAISSLWRRVATPSASEVDRP
ncbi:hypothetical protein O3P69_002577 [Scylla paramamosain]|uniref:Uncharacterized protein n=1 Tax=Scylla paramamosain TaxID=85552 RepID=A0AAW0ULG2_SCYPA